MALTYIYNKIVVTLLRAIATPTFTAQPDEVIHVPSRDPSRTIKVHVYKSSQQGKPTPVLINLHGSGFILPMHGTDDDFARRVQKDTPYAVLDVQYRLAPEDPFPAASNDAEDIVKWVLAHPEDYDPTCISISGFSAGGNLALGASGHTFPPKTFRHLIAFYPPTNIFMSPYDKVAPDPNGKPIPPWMAIIFDGMYIPDPETRMHPLASPSFIDAEKFPDNVLIITCSGDKLAPEAEEIAEKIAAVPGKHVVSERMVECDHAWDKQSKLGTVQAKAKEHAYSLAVEMLRR